MSRRTCRFLRQGEARCQGAPPQLVPAPPPAGGRALLPALEGRGRPKPEDAVLAWAGGRPQDLVALVVFRNSYCRHLPYSPKHSGEGLPGGGRGLNTPKGPGA